MARIPSPRSATLVAILLGLGACTSERVPIGTVVAARPLTADVRAVAVRAARSSIRFERGTAGEVGIRAEVRVIEARAAEFRETPLDFDGHVRTAIVDGVLEIQSAHDGRVDADDFEFAFVVAVPDDLALRATLAAGGVTARVGRIAGLEANVDAGQIDVLAEAIAGPTRLRVDAGQIDLEATAAVADIAFEIDAGRARLRLPDAPAYGLDLGVTAGDVRVANRISTTAPRRDYARSTLQVTADGPQIRGRIDAGQIVIE